MRMTRLALLLAACATTALGCADNAATDTGTNAATGTNAGGTGGGAAAGGNGTNGAGANGSSGNGSSDSNTSSSSNNTGSDNTGSNNAGTDDAAVMPPPGDCVDDESTLGNDCPGVVTCTADVDACSLATQNCCVKEYNENAVSCNEGTDCDGIVSSACDGPEDCPGDQLCCISVTAFVLPARVQQRCVADLSECTGGDILDRLLCHSDDQCGSGESCEPIPNLPWWGQCK